MKNKSNAFIEFIAQTKSTGYDRIESYNDDLFDLVDDDEINDLEDVIYKLYNFGDIKVEKFLPKLKKYDGIKLLTDELEKNSIPSKRNADVSYILWKYTNDKKYEENLINDFDIENELVRQGILWNILHITVSDEIKEFYVNTVVNDSYDAVRFMAAYGYLYCNGIVENLFNYDDESMNQKVREVVYSVQSNRAEMLKNIV